MVLTLHACQDLVREPLPILTSWTLQVISIGKEDQGRGSFLANLWTLELSDGDDTLQVKLGSALSYLVKDQKIKTWVVITIDRVDRQYDKTRGRYHVIVQSISYFDPYRRGLLGHPKLLYNLYPTSTVLSVTRLLGSPSSAPPPSHTSPPRGSFAQKVSIRHERGNPRIRRLCKFFDLDGTPYNAEDHPNSDIRCAFVHPCDGVWGLLVSRVSKYPKRREGRRRSPSPLARHSRRSISPLSPSHSQTSSSLNFSPVRRAEHGVPSTSSFKAPIGPSWNTRNKIPPPSPSPIRERPSSPTVSDRRMLSLSPIPEPPSSPTVPSSDRRDSGMGESVSTVTVSHPSSFNVDVAQDTHALTQSALASLVEGPIATPEAQETETDVEMTEPSLGMSDPVIVGGPVVTPDSKGIDEGETTGPAVTPKSKQIGGDVEMTGAPSVSAEAGTSVEEVLEGDGHGEKITRRLELLGRLFETRKQLQDLVVQRDTLQSIASLPLTSSITTGSSTSSSPELDAKIRQLSATLRRTADDLIYDQPLHTTSNAEPRKLAALDDLQLDLAGFLQEPILASPTSAIGSVEITRYAKKELGEALHKMKELRLMTREVMEEVIGLEDASAQWMATTEDWLSKLLERLCDEKVEGVSLTEDPKAMRLRIMEQHLEAKKRTNEAIAKSSVLDEAMTKLETNRASLEVRLVNLEKRQTAAHLANQHQPSLPPASLSHLDALKSSVITDLLSSSPLDSFSAQFSKSEELAMNALAEQQRSFLRSILTVIGPSLELNAMIHAWLAEQGVELEVR